MRSTKEGKRSVRPLPKIGPLKAQFGTCWHWVAAKRARERLTMSRVFKEGGYRAVRDTPKTRRTGLTTATIRPLSADD